MSIDYGQLKEPVTREDVIEQEEYLESVLETQKGLAARVKFQYQQESWISSELTAIADLINEAGERLAALRSTNCFPPS